MPCAPCCSFPNGYLTIAPGLLSIIAFILTSNSLWTCHYAQTPLGVGVGLMYREIQIDDVYNDGFYTAQLADVVGGGYCTSYALSSYSSDVLGSSFMAAQSFGLCAWIVGFFMAIAVWAVAPCVASTRVGWRIIGGLFFLIGWAQLCTLLILTSSVCSGGCELKEGGIVAIVAVILWWVTAAICYMIPGPNVERSDQFVEATLVNELEAGRAAVMASAGTTTQRTAIDGSIVIEKISTNPDGTTTVTTTVIPKADVAAEVAAARGAAAGAMTPDEDFSAAEAAAAARDAALGAITPDEDFEKR